MSLKEISIFVSSPSDVSSERLIASGVIERIGMRFAGQVKLRPVVWEYLPLEATQGYQPQIPRASEFDIVIIILWSRLGTPLPETFRRPDGTNYDSGTEYEFEDAIEGHRKNGKPKIFVYRKTADLLVSLNQGESKLLELSQQKQKVQKFIDKWFSASNGSNKPASSRFSEPSEFEEKLEQQMRIALDRMIRSGPELQSIPTTAEWDHTQKGSPFRGLERFDFEDRLIYFGRTRPVNEVLDALRRQAAVGKPFLLAFGNSGVGKSSFMRAGVLPFLIEPGIIEGIGLWRWGIFEPSDSTGDFLDGFAACILTETALPELVDSVTEDELAEMLRSSTASVVPLLRGALARRSKEKGETRRDARLAILIDPLEEIFTVADSTDAQREAFVEAMDILARSGIVWFLGTMRSDFFPACASFPKLMELKAGDGQYHLMPPSPTDIGRMIRLPAQMAGLQFEEDPTVGSLDEVLRDETISSPGGLPLLEFTLDEIYKICREQRNGVLTFEAYRRLGGLHGAVRTRADETFLTISKSLGEQADESLGAIFGSLVRVSDDPNQPIARRYSLLETITSDPAQKRIVEAFIDARLLMTDIDDQSRPVLTFSHETLLRHWPRLADWVERNLEFLRTRNRVSLAAERWEEERRDPVLLLPAGKPLLEARALLEERESDLEPQVVEFIKRSRAKANEQRRGAQLRLRIYSSVVTVLVIVAALMSVLSYQNAELAERKAELANEETRQKELKRIQALKQYESATAAQNSARLRGRQAQQLVDFLLGDVRDSLNPDNKRDRTLIDGLAVRVETHVMSMKTDQNSAENRRALDHLRTIAEVFREMGRWQTVVECCEKIREFREVLPDFEQENPDVAARIRAMHGQALDWRGRHEESLEEYSVALAVLKPHVKHNYLAAYILALRGELQRHRRKFSEAEADLETAVEVLQKIEGVELVIALGSLAELYQDSAEHFPENAEKLDLAEKIQVEGNALAVRLLATLSVDAPSTERRSLETSRLDGRSRLGTIKYDQQESDQAVEILEKVIVERLRVQGPEHPEVAADQRRVAEILIGQKKRLDDAEGFLVESLRNTGQALGEEHIRVAKIHDIWSELEIVRGDRSKAAKHLLLSAGIRDNENDPKGAAERRKRAESLQNSIKGAGSGS